MVHPTEMASVHRCDVSCQTDLEDSETSNSPVKEILKPPSPATLMRYSRENLLEVMDDELSMVSPQLTNTVKRLLNNSTSNLCLVDTLARTTLSPLKRNLLAKATTFTTFDDSTREESLLKSSTWKSSSSQESGDGWHMEDAERALKTFRSCLNKLTVDNFDAILSEVKTMRVDDDKTILNFIKLLYEKAIREPTFANHYVMLTMALKNIFTIGPAKKSFEHFVILICQQGFEMAMEKLKNINQLSDDDKNSLRRSLSGSMQFIAKMFLNKVLTARIILEISEQLLKLECTESIEPLCKLLEIVGIAIQNLSKSNEKLDKIMDKLKLQADNFPVRINFMIQNLIEQRENGWQPRVVKEGPKKMEEVANECGFVKREGGNGRYDEVEPNDRHKPHNENFRQGERFEGKKNQEKPFSGSRTRIFRFNQKKNPRS
jgi:translation initiation factor 4G